MFNHDNAQKILIKMSSFLKKKCYMVDLPFLWPVLPLPRSKQMDMFVPTCKPHATHLLINGNSMYLYILVHFFLLPTCLWGGGTFLILITLLSLVHKSFLTQALKAGNKVLGVILTKLIPLGSSKRTRRVIYSNLTL